MSIYINNPHISFENNMMINLLILDRIIQMGNQTRFNLLLSECFVLTFNRTLFLYNKQNLLTQNST